MHIATIIAVRLVFVGPSIDPDIVTQQLGVKPNESLVKGEKYILPEGSEHVPSVGMWSFSGLPVSEDDSETGTYKEWRKFLAEKSDAFEGLNRLGYEGYLEIQLPVANENEVHQKKMFSSIPPLLKY